MKEIVETTRVTASRGVGTTEMGSKLKFTILPLQNLLPSPAQSNAGEQRRRPRVL